jgi:hypothetical protein
MAWNLSGSDLLEFNCDGRMRLPLRRDPFRGLFSIGAGIAFQLHKPAEVMGSATIHCNVRFWAKVSCED